ncbi:MAG: mandelate racemase/muconate lactonizing enzyme family protein [Acidobacteria bacterium]|nr:mandelate racemase/muconate lactonizing enzyme family protein [Acidobacteriota bacterium]
MKTQIVEVSAIPLEKSLQKTFQGGTYRITSRYTLVTQVRLANGVVGQTFGGDEEKYQKEIAALINGHFGEKLRGQDVFDVERHWQAMFECKCLDQANRGIHTLDLANKAILMQAIAAVDIAVWDAMGKALELPLYKMLGGYRDEVPVIAIGGYYESGKAEKDLACELLSYKEAGLSGIKLKVGGLTPAEDADRVRFARETVGKDFLIACDANQAWTVDQALEFCRRVLGYNVRWFEEPVQWFDQLQGLALVRKYGGLPVVAGQGEISRFGCRDLLLAGAVDILNFDATIGGGITEWRRVAAMAGMCHVKMGHHEEPQVAIHLLASVPHGLYVEIFPDRQRDPMWFELPVGRPKIAHGRMVVPQEPGLGMPLRAEVIEQYRASEVPV